MTAADLRAAGYRVGSTIDNADVTRMKNVVDAAYIKRVWTGAVDTDADVKAAQMSLIFIALVGDNTYATRAGGKLKLSPSLSERGYVSQTDVDEADRLLKVLQGKEGATQGQLDRIVDDVLHLYMRTYLSMN